MPDPAASRPLSAADAEVAVARLEAMSSDLRGAAILAPDGSALGSTGSADTWSSAAAAVLSAADAAAGEPVSHAHVGTEDGEVFAIRQDGYALVAAANRFTLASLMFFDMRAVLRDLLAGPDAPSIRDAAAA